MNSQELLQAGVGLFKEAAPIEPPKTLGGAGGVGGAGLKALNPVGPKPMAGGVGGLKPPTRPPAKLPMMANKGFQDIPKALAASGVGAGGAPGATLSGPANPNRTADYSFYSSGRRPAPKPVAAQQPATPQAPQQPISPAMGGPVDAAYDQPPGGPLPDVNWDTVGEPTGNAPKPGAPDLAKDKYPGPPLPEINWQQPDSPRGPGFDAAVADMNARMPESGPVPNPRGPGFEAEIARMDGMNAPPEPGNPRGPGFEAAVADMNARMPESGPGPNPRGPGFEAEIARMDGMNEPPNPRGPGFEAEIARMDGMNAPAEPGTPGDAMASGTMESPPPDSMDLPDATARFEATGGGGAVPEQKSPWADSRFREQMEYYDSLRQGDVGGLSSRGSVIGEGQKANAQKMMDYYSGLERRGDMIASKARAGLRGGADVSLPQQNYLARRDQFETGHDPNAFNTAMSDQSADILHSGLRDQLDQAGRLSSYA